MRASTPSSPSTSTVPTTCRSSRTSSATQRAADVLHVDFLRVTEDQQIEVNVPVVLQGEVRQVTQFDGMVDQTMYEMAILVKPTAVPQEIVIDITDLELGATEGRRRHSPRGCRIGHGSRRNRRIAPTRSTREAIRRAEQGEAAEAEGLKALKADEGESVDEGERRRG